MFFVFINEEMIALSAVALASLPTAARFDFPDALQLSPVQQEIRPIYSEGGNNNDSRVLLFRSCPKRNPQARRPRNQNDERVRIKDGQPAQCRKDEWIPLDGGEKMSLKKLNR